ncbi:MAG TPA: sulfatase-like hydrolase/transferase [Vicinamibacteria bacterium]
MAEGKGPRRVGRPILLLAASLAALSQGGLVGCRGARKTEPARHVVIVTIDTLRADRLGVYGNSQVETPRLDRIAREGAMAEQATAHVPLTRPSHVSLFTGRLPFETGIRDNVSPAVVPETPLLASTLKEAGFATAAFVSSVVLDPTSGLNRGFDTYSAVFEGSGGDAQFLSTVQKKGHLTTAEAIAWLGQTAAGTGTASGSPRVFLWLHLYDPHDPYEPPEPYITRYADRPYDGEVAYADELVGRLDDALTRLRLRDQTLLVVTSDHGEGLGEHGETLHGFFAYQTTLRIPFLARGPGVQAGTRLRSTLRLVDVVPTVLDLVGIAPPKDARYAGVSLAAALGGAAERAEPVTYAESLVPLLHFGWSDLRVLREARWKYIQAPRPELYDLETDPAETKNLLAGTGGDALASRGAAMREALGRFLDAERASPGASASGGAVPPELLEKLGALGYVGGGAPADTSTPGADPKDKLEDFRIANASIREGLLRFHDKDYRTSVGHFETVLKRGISSFEVHFYLARSLSALDRRREAAKHYEEAARRLPAHAAAWEGLADSRAATGDPNGALEALRRGQAALPKDAGLRLAEARLLRDLGRRAEAIPVYEAALPLAPTNARARAALGDLLRDTGDVEGAIRRQREAVQLDASNASYWNSLGMTLGGSGHLQEAEQAFREAFRLDDKNHHHAYNLGLALMRLGRPQEARPFFEKTLALDPRFAPARQQLAQLARP